MYCIMLVMIIIFQMLNSGWWFSIQSSPTTCFFCISSMCIDCSCRYYARWENWCWKRSCIFSVKIHLFRNSAKRRNFYKNAKRQNHSRTDVIGRAGGWVLFQHVFMDSTWYTCTRRCDNVDKNQIFSPRLRSVQYFILKIVVVVFLIIQIKSLIDESC